MANWIDVACVDDCPPGGAVELVVANRVVALYNVDGRFHALDGICPHQGGPLGKGKLAGSIVTCPWHGWQFNVASGCHQLNASIVQESYPVRVDGDRILIEIESQVT